LRWNSIIKEAVEQSERLWKPSILNGMDIIDWLKSRDNLERVSISVTREEKLYDLNQWLRKQQEFVNKKGGIIWNVIGPEGGWSSKEIDFFNKNNIALVKLSDTILRTSTASINASSILNQWRIDMKLLNYINMDLIRNQFLIGFCINFILIYIFCKIPLMTKCGWVSAGILGTILWGCLSWQGWMSVVIYLLFGSLVTKIGFKFKKEQGIAEKRGGKRGPENVWGSAATGLFLAIMTKFNPANVEMFKIGFAASFAAKLADTFGSEIGKRFGKDTYLITSLKKVDRGTEGGVSLEGTLASFLGSIFMAFVMFRLSIISTKYHFIVVAVSGFLATLSESIIGAKFQNKYKLSNELVNAIQTSIASVFAIFALILYSYFLN